MAFYNPLSLEINGLPVIVYLDQGLEKVMDRKIISIRNHIKDLLDKHGISKGADYLILILWTKDGKIMTDAWVFTKTDSWGSGPLADAKIFRGYAQVTDIGIGSGNTLIMLGREEEQRRNSLNLKDYLSGPRPKLPDFLLLREDFPK
jgi:hypothetical protein